MKVKYIRKGMAFILIFVFLFASFQEVLRYKWENAEFISTRMECYENEPEGTIDILYLGASNIYAGITPMIMWNDYGITGMNFGSSLQNAMCCYYLFQYAVQIHKPKVLVIQLNAAFDDRKADEAAYESTYRKFAEVLPDQKIRWNLVNDIVKDNEKQSVLSYYLPLIRYHERWTEIKKTDFIPIEWYQDYFKGGLLNAVTAPVEEIERSYDYEDVELSEYSMEYYTRIFDYCKSEDIQVMVISPPYFDPNRNYARYEKLGELCSEYGLDYINYNESTCLENLQLDLEKDYYDTEHLSITGSFKLTHDLGKRIQEMYGIENHKGDGHYKGWDENWSKFADRYSGILDSMNYAYCQNPETAE